MPAAIAAAAPPLDPPVVRSSFHGLRVTPQSGLSLKPLWPNSPIAVMPIGMPPAAFRRCTATASWFATLCSNM